MLSRYPGVVQRNPFLGALLPAVLVVSSVASALTLPALSTRGDQSVGVKTLKLTDPARQRTFTVEIWYPAIQPDKPLTYPVDYRGQVVAYPGQAARDAAAQPGKFPLILVSHGQPGSRYQLASLLEHLASRGFVVASVEHTGSTIADFTPPAYISSIVDRPLDLLFTLRELTKRVPSADANNVGLLGYSYGGYTVANTAGAGLDSAGLKAYCTQTKNEGPCFALPYFAPLEQSRGRAAAKADGRIKAVFQLSPYGEPWVAGSLKNLKVPLFVAAGDADAVATYKRDPVGYFTQAGSKEKYFLTLKGAQHNPFVDCPAGVPDPTTCNDRVWDQSESRALARHFATAFFDKYLKGDHKAANALNPALNDLDAALRAKVTLQVGR